MLFKKMLSLAVCLVIIAEICYSDEKYNTQISRQLANPLADIVNIPFQFNWDYGGGPNDDGQHYYLQIQPIIPINFIPDVMVISRTILPVENKNSFGFDSVTGLGDITQTFFFTIPPRGDEKFIWGVGPVILIPTATSGHLGQDNWAFGPSAVLVFETEKWTFGVLANHMWSFDGSNHYDINKLFLQPFIAYQLPHAFSITVTSEYTYDWNSMEEIFPINFMAAKVFALGKIPISFTIGGRYYIDKPAGGPDWGLRAMLTVALPGF